MCVRPPHEPLFLSYVWVVSPNYLPNNAFGPSLSINEQSAIMSVVSEDPSVAYVKTGVLAKSGMDLPPPKVQAWWRRAEVFEKPFLECDIVE